MTKFLRSLCLWALTLGSGAPWAQTDSATAESLLRKSGLWEQLSTISPQIESGMMAALSQAGVKPSTAEVERIARAVKETHADHRLRATVVRVVTENLKWQLVADLQQWYDSPVGRQITKLEEAASTEGGDPKEVMRQGAEVLGQTSPQRRKLLEELLVEMRAAEALTQITINTTMAAQRGAASVLPDSPAMSAAEVKAALEAQRPQLLKVFSALVLAGFARSYQPLTTDQLNAYVSFAKSDAGSHFNTVCIEALDAALSEAATELGRRLPSTRDQANT